MINLIRMKFSLTHFVFLLYSVLSESKRGQPFLTVLVFLFYYFCLITYYSPEALEVLDTPEYGQMEVVGPHVSSKVKIEPVI